jgi:hypothetical protein
MIFRGLHALIALGISTMAVLFSMSGCAGAPYLLVTGNGVLRYDQTGAFIDVFVPLGSGGLEDPRGLAFGTDGNLYVTSVVWSPQQLVGQVLRYNGTTGAFIDVFVPPGSGGLNNPISLAFGPDCNLYVPSDAQVLRYNGTTGEFVDAFVPTGSGGLKGRSDLVFGPDGHLYLANDDVLRYHGTTGAFLGTFVPNGTGGLWGAGVLAFGPDGHLFLGTSQPFALVSRFNGSTGAFIDDFLGWISEGSINDLVFGPDGHLYVGLEDCTGLCQSSVRRYHGATGAFLGLVVAPDSGWRFAAGEVNLAFKPRPVMKQIDTLLVAVGNLRVPADIEKAFKNPLQNARAAYEAGALLAARNQLGSFTDMVRGNTGNLIPVPQANRLVIAANALRDRLRCL